MEPLKAAAYGSAPLLAGSSGASRSMSAMESEHGYSYDNQQRQQGYAQSSRRDFERYEQLMQDQREHEQYYHRQQQQPQQYRQPKGNIAPHSLPYSPDELQVELPGEFDPASRRLSHVVARASLGGDAEMYGRCCSLSLCQGGD
jgi:hypothetical protein